MAAFGCSPRCVLAGYIIPGPSVDAFSNAWRDALNEAPAIDYFKMKEAESRRGQFWGFSEFERNHKVEALVHVVKAYALCGVGSFVSHKAYDAIARKALPPTVDHPYWLCFHGVIATVLHLYEEELPLHKIDFVLDTQGVGFERRGTMMHENMRELIPEIAEALFGSIGFADDKAVLPLQAADLLAWHIRRHANVMATSGHPENRPIADLLWSIKTITKAWEPEELAAFVELYQALHPQSSQNLDLTKLIPNTK